MGTEEWLFANGNTITDLPYEQAINLVKPLDLRDLFMNYSSAGTPPSIVLYALSLTAYLRFPRLTLKFHASMYSHMLVLRFMTSNFYNLFCLLSGPFSLYCLLLILKSPAPNIL